MRITRSFKKDDLQEGQKILIYGAGIYGELAKCLLDQVGVKVDFFIDKKLCGKRVRGIEVICPEEIKKYTKDIVLIASVNYFDEMLNYLISQNVENIYDIYELMKIDIDDKVLNEYLLDEKKNSHRYLFAVNSAATDMLIINHCVIVVTEQCTLNCKDCATLMPYYKQPKAISAEENIKTLSNLLKTVDKLNDLRILGGEPFLSRDLDVFLAWALQAEKIDIITFYSNATIIPQHNVLELMKSPKVILHLSDYGINRDKIERWKSVCEKNKIQYYIHNYQEWYDYGNLEKRNRLEEEKKALFESCGMKTCYTFYRGRFYTCGRCPHGEAVGAFTNPNTDFVDFTEDNFDIIEKRKKIRTVMRELPYVEACNYCDGGNLHSKMIKAAIQTPRNSFFDK